MTKFFETPFAQAGNKTAVPNALQPDGSISYTEGWSADYELPNTDPDYKPIGREQTNQMFFDITEAMGLVQREGILFWDTTFAYSQHARVIGSDGQVYKAVIANTGNDPTTDLGTNWIVVPQVIASQAEAEAGENNINVMTPLRIAQARGATGQWIELVANKAWRNPFGIIIQTDRFLTTTGADVSIVFPVAFPNQCFSVVCQHDGTGATGNFTSSAVGTITTGFSASSFTANTGSRTANRLAYIAIGY